MLSPPASPPMPMSGLPKTLQANGVPEDGDGVDGWMLGASESRMSDMIVRFEIMVIKVCVFFGDVCLEEGVG